MLSNLLERLKRELPASDAAVRKQMATLLCEQNIYLKDLLPLAFEDEKVSSRFFWLLSDVADIEPQRLMAVLPRLLELRDQTSYPKLNRSLARYWNVYGLPEESEGEAMDLLFQWFSEIGADVTQKLHSLYALQKLSVKYPEIRTEIILAIRDQLGKSTQGFERMAVKVLGQLEGQGH